MLLIIDNYDSFVFNLARYVEELGQPVLVVRNDKVTLAAIKDLAPSHIIISPGPCGPTKAGISIPLVQNFAGKIPILGVCLGHQVIGHVFGADILRAKVPMHGKSSIIEHDNQGVFTNLPNPLTVGRYHSLIVCGTKLSKELTINALSSEGEIMAISSTKHKLVGVQFHPESVLTEYGLKLMANFIDGVSGSDLYRISQDKSEPRPSN